MSNIKYFIMNTKPINDLPKPYGEGIVLRLRPGPLHTTHSPNVLFLKGLGLRVKEVLDVL